MDTRAQSHNQEQRPALPGGCPRVPQAAFSLGDVILTPGARAVIQAAGQPIDDLLAPHVRGQTCVIVSTRNGLQFTSRLPLSTGASLQVVTEARPNKTTTYVHTLDS